MHTGFVRPASGLNLREKPNGQKIKVLLAQEEMEILEEVRFLRVKTSEGITGYVQADYINESPSGNDLVLSDIDTEDFPSPTFKLVKFQGENFIGQEARVDSDFANLLSRVDKYAGDCGVKVWVTSSTRNINQQVRGAIVPPASKSCHHVGHAVDMNVQYDGELYNSKKLRKSNLKNLPDPVVKFIQSIRGDDKLRWGGDFGTEDPVHIDDNLFRKEEIIYLAKLQSRVQQLNA